MPRPVALVRGSQIGELWKHSLAWLRQARLQFQPMYFINYSVGAAAAYTTAQRFNVGLYQLGFIVLYLGVLCAALTNDYYDYPTDRINKNAGMRTERFLKKPF